MVELHGIFTKMTEMIMEHDQIIGRYDKRCKDFISLENFSFPSTGLTAILMKRLRTSLAANPLSWSIGRTFPPIGGSTLRSSPFSSSSQSSGLSYLYKLIIVFIKRERIATSPLVHRMCFLGCAWFILRR